MIAYFSNNLFDTRLDKRHEQRMRVQHGRGVFGMELRTNVPAERGDFHYLDEVG